MIGGVFRLVIVAGRPSLRPEPRMIVPSSATFLDAPLSGRDAAQLMVDDLGVPDREGERSGGWRFRHGDGR